MREACHVPEVSFSHVIVLTCCRLIPFSVVIYTVAGGLKATFTSSYLHTVCTLQQCTSACVLMSQWWTLNHRHLT